MMHNDGLTKLMEECGELVQACAKKAAYPDSVVHPDGRNLKDSLVEEMADVLAAIDFVSTKFSLDRTAIEVRARSKFRKFSLWDIDGESCFPVVRFP
jgi:NTP pyrophosphatase (non-canonical NTP hydrolase)